MKTHVATAYAEHRIDIQGDGFYVYEWGARSAEVPTVVLAHATGFHGRCWLQAVACMPQSWHVVAIDSRGHGQSSEAGAVTWQQFSDDQLALLQAMDLQGVIGVGHSMGGHCMAHSCARQPDLFSALLLIDPVILAPSETVAAAARVASLDDHPVARRKAEFASWQAMAERFAGRDPYDIWQVEVFEDYCRYGVLPTADGVRLACPPRFEAAVYMGSGQPDIVPLLQAVQQPVHVLRGRRTEQFEGMMDFKNSPTWPELAGAFARGADFYLPDLTHFIPMQQPQLVYEHVQQLLSVLDV